MFFIFTNLEEGEQRLEDKVMYGTDSESDNELLAAQLLRQ
jgi:hypothetical protein